MLSILISMVIGAIVGFATVLPTGLHPYYGAGAGVAAFALVYIILLKRVMNKVNEAMELAQKDLMAQRSEKAVKTLEMVQKKYGKWQFFVAKQMNSQIGMIYYLNRKFDKAFEYLEKGFVRHWVAQAMLGIIYMKRNKTGKMIDTFEKTVSGTRKEPLLWNLYAYCLEKSGDVDKAISVMQKGLKKAGDSELMQENLTALQNGKKMKMQAYGDMWYQFHLEKPGAMVRKQTKMVQGRRKVVRR